MCAGAGVHGCIPVFVSVLYVDVCVFFTGVYARVCALCWCLCWCVCVRVYVFARVYLYEYLFYLLCKRMLPVARILKKNRQYRIEYFQSKL